MKRLRLLLLSAAMLGSLLSMQSADANDIIFRYKQGLTFTDPGSGTDTGGGTGTTDPTGPTTPTSPTGPVACGAAADSPYTCAPGTTRPSTTGSTPLVVTLTSSSPSGAAKPYQCFHITGGYGNYVIWASPDMGQSLMKSLDVVAADDLNAADSFAVSYEQYPGYSDDYDYISQTPDVCVRVTPSGGDTDQSTLAVTLTVADYATSAVADGKANYMDNNYDQTTNLALTISANAFPAAPPPVDPLTIGMRFTYGSYYNLQRAFGPAASAQLTESTSNVVKGGDYYDKCWTYSGGWPSTQFKFFIDTDLFDPLPAWVDWIDVRPVEDIDVGYQKYNKYTPANVIYGVWPLDSNVVTNSYTNSTTACVRIHVKPDVLDTTPLHFDVAIQQFWTVMNADGTPVKNYDGSDSIDNQGYFFDVYATPVDYTTSGSSGGSSGGGSGGDTGDNGDGAPS